MIEISGLQKVIDQKLALDIPELAIGAGQVVALVGPADSGKDALFGLLTGQSRPTAGTVSLAQVDPFADQGAFSEVAGVLFAGDNLYQHQSPRANLLFQCRLRGLPKSRADQVLAQVGLADHANAKLGRLSSGMLRRLAFGRAILHSPQVVLLHTPFARCDEASISLLSNLIRQQARKGTALLILADSTSGLAGLCDTVHSLEQGSIVDSYDPEAQRPDLPFKIPARTQDKVVLVNPVDILYALAKDGRAHLATAEGQLPTQFTLAEVEHRLARSGFFRAHRGYLVNLQHVREVIPYTRNSYSLILDDASGTEIPLSKSAAGELRELLGY